MIDLARLETLLSEELSWRRSEINRLHITAESSLTDGESRIHTALNKSLTLLLYSHWEGFIKKSSLIYLQYISDQQCNMADLSINFKILALRKSMKKLANAHPKDGGRTVKLSSVLGYFSEYDEVVTGRYFIKTYYDDADKYKNNSLINTESNLNKNVFSSILENLGMKIHDYYLEDLIPPFRNCLVSEEDKSLIAQVIDQTLLKCRNHNAHGRENSEHAVLSFETLKYLKQIILVMMQQFSDDILEYSTEKYYLEINKESKETYHESANQTLKQTIQDILVEYHSRLEDIDIIEGNA
ncbi:MAE_28990/MAE_18760 family HEPN-like nuclease [Acinetobacter sp. XS-4]|uniref:MAE_28990/MAE_18760 family HEPN-like nuclease n=1 Tax=Acinetobacter sp. XS-4 TaxID=2923375 RepID=UPI00208DE253|nr:MAE_28990/MAE_18760 family HEPN-like nuclease [Acinetobacter sp. XS-4]USP40728.1 MAE_28990/MAE_18760 family HEPN-like nuclease [Acinetobacter sp. XS-4]